MFRDVKDTSVGTLAQRIASQVGALKGLLERLQGIQEYLMKVCRGQLPINHQIIYLLQDIFNLLPNVTLEEFAQMLAIRTNDQMLAIYLASLVRSVIALHNLVSNKLTNREAEKREGEKKESDKKEGEKKEQEKIEDQKKGSEKEKSGSANSKPTT
jgi:26S proteasome regulatory subunit N8